MKLPILSHEADAWYSVVHSHSHYSKSFTAWFNLFLRKIFFKKFLQYELVSRTHRRAWWSGFFFEINIQTPRKLAVSMMEDAIKSLDTEQRPTVTKDLHI